MTHYHATALYALLAVLALLFTRPVMAEEAILTPVDIIQIALPGEPCFDLPYQTGSCGSFAPMAR